MNTSEGYISVAEGLRLYYRIMGDGPEGDATPRTDWESRVAAEISRDEVVEIARHAVRFSTVNPPGGTCPEQPPPPPPPPPGGGKWGTGVWNTAVSDQGPEALLS